MKSSSHLKQEALNYRFNSNVPLKLYLTTCISIVEEAQNSARCNNMERAYLLYIRYLDLCLNRLVHHSEVNTSVESLYKREYFQLLKLEVPAIMKITEELKIKIDARYKSLANNVATSTYARSPAVMMTNPSDEINLPSSFDEQKFNQSISWFNHSSKHFSAQSDSNNEYPELPELNVTSTSVTYTMPAL
ncbi:Rfu1 [Kluyveromyces lactis]|nr:Rfu1 [Kluyveromyces lactis]